MTSALQQMIAEGTNKYEHASFLILVSFYKIEFFAKHLSYAIFKNNLKKFLYKHYEKNFHLEMFFSKIF